MGFASEVTPEESAVGFRAADHIAFGRIVFAQLGVGIRAVKMVGDHGAVNYAICDDNGIVLYQPAESLSELRQRFGLRQRSAG